MRVSFVSNSFDLGWILLTILSTRPLSLFLSHWPRRPSPLAASLEEHPPTARQSFHSSAIRRLPPRWVPLPYFLFETVSTLFLLSSMPEKHAANALTSEPAPNVGYFSCQIGLLLLKYGRRSNDDSKSCEQPGHLGCWWLHQRQHGDQRRLQFQCKHTAAASIPKHLD